MTNYAKAIETGDPDDNPKIAELYIQLARDKYQLGDYTGAVAEYDEYIRQHPWFGKGLFKGGAVEIYVERGNTKYAAKEYAGAISWNIGAPNRVMALYN